MDFEDLEPRAKKPDPVNLDIMSVEALNDYIAELEAEIARVREAIAHKQASRASAEDVFR